MLRARFGDGRTQTIHLRNERAVVGATACDIVVDDAGVSAEHAELLFRDGILGIRDLGSTHGTWVCDRRVDRAILKRGRWFRVGRARFELVDIRTPEQAVLDVRGGYANGRFDGAVHGSLIVDVSVVGSGRSPGSPHQRSGREPPPPPPRHADAPGRAGPLVRVAPLDASTHVVIAEADAATAGWLRDALHESFPCVAVSSGREAFDHVQATERAVVIIGRHLADMPPGALVERLLDPSLRDQVTILAAEGVAPRCDRIFYRLGAGLPPDALVGIVASAAKQGNRPAVQLSGTRAWSSKHVFEICGQVNANPDPAAAAFALEEGIGRIMSVSRARCAFYDADSGLMWTESPDAPIETVATRGIVGFVARTGRAVHAPEASRDPRYDASVDDPIGRGNEAILAVPAPGPDGQIHAVLLAVREPTQGYFDQRACDTLAQLGSEVGPVLHRLCKLVEAEEVLEAQHGGGAMQLFRPEALEAHREIREDGDVIRVAPHWSRTMYWALLGMLIVSLFGIAIGELTQYSTGVAVIRQEGRAEVYAASTGALTAIDVDPGQRVHKGQVLARLSDVSERANYDATRQDFHAQLRNRLLDPTDEAAAAQAQTLRRQLDAAQAALELRVLRAPHDGLVTDIGIDEGSPVQMGDPVMSVVDDRVQGLEVVAFLPGGDRPQIDKGMTLRLELSGFDYAYQDVVVDSISEAVVGPNEAKRMLGPQLADTLPIGGGVVMVRARLPTTTFESDGTVYPYHDGMGGTAELRLRDETILEMLIPALREL